MGENVVGIGLNKVFGFPPGTFDDITKFGGPLEAQSSPKQLKPFEAGLAGGWVRADPPKTPADGNWWTISYERYGITHDPIKVEFPTQIGRDQFMQGSYLQKAIDRRIKNTPYDPFGLPAIGVGRPKPEPSQSNWTWPTATQIPNVGQTTSNPVKEAIDQAGKVAASVGKGATTEFHKLLLNINNPQAVVINRQVIEPASITWIKSVGTIVAETKERKQVDLKSGSGQDGVVHFWGEKPNGQKIDLKAKGIDKATLELRRYIGLSGRNGSADMVDLPNASLAPNLVPTGTMLAALGLAAAAPHTQTLVPTSTNAIQAPTIAHAPTALQPFFGANLANADLQKLLPKEYVPILQGLKAGLVVYYPNINTLFATTGGQPVTLGGISLNAVVTISPNSRQIGLGNAHEIMGSGNFWYWNVRTATFSSISKNIDQSRNEPNTKIIIGQMSTGIATLPLCPSDGRKDNPGNLVTTVAVGTGGAAVLYAENGELKVSVGDKDMSTNMALAVYQAVLSAGAYTLTAANITRCKTGELQEATKEVTSAIMDEVAKNLTPQQMLENFVAIATVAKFLVWDMWRTAQ